MQPLVFFFSFCKPERNSDSSWRYFSQYKKKPHLNSTIRAKSCWQIVIQQTRRKRPKCGRLWPLNDYFCSLAPKDALFLQSCLIWTIRKMHQIPQKQDTSPALTNKNELRPLNRVLRRVRLVSLRRSSLCRSMSQQFRPWSRDGAEDSLFIKSDTHHLLLNPARVCVCVTVISSVTRSGESVTVCSLSCAAWAPSKPDTFSHSIYLITSRGENRSGGGSRGRLQTGSGNRTKAQIYSYLRLTGVDIYICLLGSVPAGWIFQIIHWAGKMCCWFDSKCNVVMGQPECISFTNGSRTIKIAVTDVDRLTRPYSIFAG